MKIQIFQRIDEKLSSRIKIVEEYESIAHLALEVYDLIKENIQDSNILALYGLLLSSYCSTAYRKIVNRDLETLVQKNI